MRLRAGLATGTFAAATTALLAFAPGAFAFFTVPKGVSPNAESINSLYTITLVIALVIFFAVEGALLYAVIKFRARRGAAARQIHGNTRLEMGWTLGAGARPGRAGGRHVHQALIDPEPAELRPGRTQRRSAKAGPSSRAPIAASPRTTNR